MVVLRARRREMRADGGNHHEELGHKRIRCASQYTVHNTAGTSPDPACHSTDACSTEPIQASSTPDASYLPVSISFPSSSPISLFLIHNSTISAALKVKSSLCISPCHDDALTTGCSIRWVQLTTSAAYTVCSIYQTVTSGLGPGPNRTIAKLMVQGVNKPELPTQVWFHGKLPTRLNWADCQQVAQRVHL